MEEGACKQRRAAGDLNGATTVRTIALKRAIFYTERAGRDKDGTPIQAREESSGDEDGASIYSQSAARMGLKAAAVVRRPGAVAKSAFADKESATLCADSEARGEV